MGSAPVESPPRSLRPPEPARPGDHAVGGADQQSQVLGSPAAGNVSHRRRGPRLFLAEQLVVTLVVVTAAVLGDMTWPGVALLATLLAAAPLWRGVHQQRRHTVPVRALIQDGLVAFAIFAIAVAWLLPAGDLRGAIFATGVGTVVAIASAWLRLKLQPSRRVVFVGDATGVAGALARWAEQSASNVVAVAVMAGHEGAQDGPTAVEVTRPSDLHDEVDSVVPLLRQCRPDLVVAIPGPGLSPRQVRELAWHVEQSGAGFAIFNPVDGVGSHRYQPDEVDGLALTHVLASHPTRMTRLVKRAADVVLSAALATVLAPLLLLLWIAIRLDSHGAGVFTQVRVGKDGSPFRIYKLRTMVSDAEQVKAEINEDHGNELLFKHHSDPRITRVGAVLRRTSLDELPQLFNVLKGDMSLVGPRPALPGEVEQYTELEMRRLTVRPGITGLWQVSGRSSLNRDRSAQLDAYYADNLRLSRDVQILVRTVKAVAGGDGAY